MKYVIDKNAEESAYLQLYYQIKEDIVKELYPYGSKLPSKRTVAEETQVSTVTVEHAYALLCDEGYIEPKQRSGYFVNFRITDAFATSSKKETVFNIPAQHSAAAAEFPFSVLAKTMRSVVSDYGEAILERSENLGCIQLRKAIKQYLERSRGIIADTKQIVIGSGSEYLYSLIVELLGRDKIYAIEAPSYKKIEQVYKTCDVKYEMLPLGIDGIESTALRGSKADILHISPYRSFPSGVTASASKKHEYMRWAKKNNRYIIEDDFESEFTILKKAEETLFSISHGNVIYMNTFSKTLSPSLRVGYMVLPEILVPSFEQKLGFYSCTVSTFIQIVLARLIENGDFERHINRVRRKKRKENPGI